MEFARGCLNGLIISIVLWAIILTMFCGCSARYSIPMAAGADIATTEVALNRYELQEGNPVLQSTTSRVAWKVGLTIGLVWLSEEMDRQGRHGVARAVQWITTGLWASAAAWNAHLMGRAE